MTLGTYLADYQLTDYGMDMNIISFSATILPIDATQFAEKGEGPSYLFRIWLCLHTFQLLCPFPILSVVLGIQKLRIFLPGATLPPPDST